MCRRVCDQYQDFDRLGSPAQRVYTLLKSTAHRFRQIASTAGIGVAYKLFNGVYIVSEVNQVSDIGVVLWRMIPVVDQTQTKMTLFGSDYFLKNFLDILKNRLIKICFV